MATEVKHFHTLRKFVSSSSQMLSYYYCEKESFLNDNWNERLKTVHVSEPYNEVRTTIHEGALEFKSEIT